MSPFPAALRTLRFQLGIPLWELSPLKACDRSCLPAFVLGTGYKPTPSTSFAGVIIAALKLSETEAKEPHQAQERPRLTCGVAPDSLVEIYDFDFELFARLDRLSAKEIHVLTAVLDLGDPKSSQVGPAPGRLAQQRPVGRDDPMEETM